MNVQYYLLQEPPPSIKKNITTLHPPPPKPSTVTPKRLLVGNQLLRHPILGVHSRPKTVEEMLRVSGVSEFLDSIVMDMRNRQNPQEQDSGGDTNGKKNVSIAYEKPLTVHKEIESDKSSVSEETANNTPSTSKLENEQITVEQEVQSGATADIDTVNLPLSIKIEREEEVTVEEAVVDDPANIPSTSSQEDTVKHEYDDDADVVLETSSEIYLPRLPGGSESYVLPLDEESQKRLIAKLKAYETRCRYLTNQLRVVKKIPRPQKRFSELSKNSRKRAADKLHVTLQCLFPHYTQDDIKSLVDAAFPPRPSAKFSTEETAEFQRDIKLTVANMDKARKIMTRKFGYSVFASRRKVSAHGRNERSEANAAAADWMEKEFGVLNEESGNDTFNDPGVAPINGDAGGNMVFDF